jgi:hypothetical protein
MSRWSHQRAESPPAMRCPAVRGSSCRRQTRLASRVRPWSLLVLVRAGALYNLNLNLNLIFLCSVAQGVPGPCRCPSGWGTGRTRETTVLCPGAASGDMAEQLHGRALQGRGLVRACKHAGIMLLSLVFRPWAHVGLTCALCGMRRQHACLAPEHDSSQTASPFLDVHRRPTVSLSLRLSPSRLRALASLVRSARSSPAREASLAPTLQPAKSSEQLKPPMSTELRASDVGRRDGFGANPRRGRGGSALSATHQPDMQTLHASLRR